MEPIFNTVKYYFPIKIKKFKYFTSYPDNAFNTKAATTNFPGKSRI